ncbi:hypothetical protein BGX21_008144 [Mortierella sp. AD011]|nr:hypothetical protein BGX20_010429 [Mortierella sp. AD010]KAF9398122.1 hypothetical protein BGX21_008144 [Mortierella sp. AD011]
MSSSISALSLPPSSPPLSIVPSTQKDVFNYDEKQYLEELEQQSICLEEAEGDSSIEEVRVTVSNNDDPSMPYNTFRMWFLGLTFTAMMAFVNEFFYLRQTSITIGYSIIALISLPLGHFMAKVLPTRTFRIPISSSRRFSFTLNPGPFTIKEHVLIGTMAACNTSNAYAVDIIIIQKVFYNDEKSFLAGLLLVLTTQITGFAIAGAVRRFLVRPAHMVWPQTLVSASLFRSLHAQYNDEKNKKRSKGGEDLEDDTGRMSRMKYFLLLTFGSFMFYWLPGFIFPTIGMISWICWINPENPVLAQLTGSSGLGIGTISLDWSAITYYFSPMVTPWFAQVNIMVGFVALVYVMVPLAYYTDLWSSKSFPIVSSDLFRVDGTSYNVSEVLGSDGYLDEDMYQAYGPLRMSTFFVLAYGVGFASLSATVVHTILYHGKELAMRWRASLQVQTDVHSRLMCAYPEVPDWWYALMFLVTVALSFVTCAVYDFMPWWALILALFIAIIFVIPVGIVQAITNQQPGLNIVTEYVIGMLLPGHPIANVTFKTYGYIVNVQALSFASDLKLGHYMKIPPQIMFQVQLVSCIIASVINLGTATWLIKTQPNICQPEGYPFTCRSTRTFYSASVIWGAIGPARVFGGKDGALYSSVQWGFLIGALLPMIFWFISKKLPRVSWLKKVHWPALLTSTSTMPPALPYFYSNGFFVGFIFAFLLRRYRFNWWSRYNYLTNAALNAGVALSGLVIYFALQYWGVKMPYWWGNPDPSSDNLNDWSHDHCYKSSLGLRSS